MFVNFVLKQIVKICTTNWFQLWLFFFIITMKLSENLAFRDSISRILEDFVLPLT